MYDRVLKNKRLNNNYSNNKAKIKFNYYSFYYYFFIGRIISSDY